MKSSNRALFITIFALLVVVFFSLGSGRYPKGGFTNPFSLLDDPLFKSVLLEVRLPRIILALTGGAVLATSGFVFQMIFANPLIEPGFLGVSQGAAFGAALAILLFPFSSLIIQLSASFFGLLALFLSYHLAKRFHFGGWILRLILSGIAVGAIFSSALSTIKLLATPGSSLQDITFWMMGGLYNSSWKTAWTILPIMWASLLFFVLLRWRINLFSLDDKITFSLGIAVGKEKTLFLIVATVATTAFISVSGIVGWVGLIIPHLARGVFGSDGRKALPGTLLFGSIFLLISDTLGRTLFSGEIPLGVITSFFGAVIFIGVLSSRQLKVKL